MHRARAFGRSLPAKVYFFRSLHRGVKADRLTTNYKRTRSGIFICMYTFRKVSKATHDRRFDGGNTRSRRCHRVQRTIVGTFLSVTTIATINLRVRKRFIVGRGISLPAKLIYAVCLKIHVASYEILYFYAVAQFRRNKIETSIHGNRNITRISVYVDNYIWKMYYGIERAAFF